MNTTALGQALPGKATGNKTSNKIPLLGFFFFALASLALFLIPAVIIRPFAYQAPKSLYVAMAVRTEGPLLTAITTAFALIIAVLLWKRVSWLWKGVLILVGVLACASAVMARIDYFEWMFHPVPAAGFEPVSQTKLDPSQMVIAVRVGADSRAYPIRAMAYYHILNDVVGGVPIAATY